MVPWVMIAALAAQKLDEQRKKKEAKREALEDTRASFAADMGAPMYGHQYRKRMRDVDDMEGEDYLSELLPYLQKGK